MKIQVRQNCFETNSSSTHAICIANTVDIEKKIQQIKEWDGIYYFRLGQYGWEHEEYYEVGDYLYTIARDDDELFAKFKQKVEEYFESEGVLVDFEEPDKDIWGIFHHYVDHGWERKYVVEWAISSRDNFFRTVLGNSMVFIGNDNDDSYESVKDEYNNWCGEDKFIE